MRMRRHGQEIGDDRGGAEMGGRLNTLFANRCVTLNRSCRLQFRAPHFRIDDGAQFDEMIGAGIAQDNLAAGGLY